MSTVRTAAANLREAIQHGDAGDVVAAKAALKAAVQAQDFDLERDRRERLIVRWVGVA